MKSFNFNRVLYVSFVLISIYYLLSGNFIEASGSLGIGLAFDPFDSNQPWKERPKWQKIWLIVHLGLAAAAFGYALGYSDK
jgi:hypothetical protein